MTYYSREITMPTTKREGLSNFVQMVINQLEAGDHREALLRAVDLLQDIDTGIYDAAITDRAMKVQAQALSEMAAKHQAEVTAAYERGVSDGTHNEKGRIAKALGLFA